MSDGVVFDVKVDFDTMELRQRVQGAADMAQKKLDVQVLKDSNYYCPFYTGALYKSGIGHTVLGTGKVIWETPYAKAQYYGYPNKYKLKNPNAQMKWFEAAKAVKSESWRKLVNDEFNKNFK